MIVTLTHIIWIPNSQSQGLHPWYHSLGRDKQNDQQIRHAIQCQIQDLQVCFEEGKIIIEFVINERM